MLQSFRQQERLLLEAGDSIRQVLEERHHRSLLDRLEEALSKLTDNRL